MTLEDFREPLPAADAAGRARIELDSLFARPQPAVSVTVKKRRWAGGADAAPAAGAPVAQHGSPVPAEASAPPGPRVHRLAGPTPRAPSTDEAWAGAQAAPTPTSAPRARRTRAARDPLRRPGAVHILLQAPPPRPTAPADLPAWQRILCVPPPPVSARALLQALATVQDLLAQAQRARGLHFGAAPR